MTRITLGLFTLVLTTLSFAGPASAQKVDENGILRSAHLPNFQHQEQDQEATARAFIRQHWQQLGLQQNAKNLSLVSQRSSLLATHYRFQQMLDGIPIENAFVVVSVKENNQIYRIGNTTVDAPFGKTAPAIRLDQADAIDVTWHHLRVHGTLRVAPETKEMWVHEDGDFRLVQRVLIETDAPRGTWLTSIDANTGEVVRVKNIMPHAKEDIDFQAYSGMLSSMDKELEDLRIRHEYRTKLLSKKGKSVVNGSGYVFDPDPRTTLNDQSITNNSDRNSDVFEAAYYQKVLRDITRDDETGAHTLTGPWVSIVDESAPTGAPSTTMDGHWTAKRANPSDDPNHYAFNDVMTYYHLDHSQRYIQAMGFTGEKGIQEGSILADSFGAGGVEVDNSFFNPSSNMVEFGHGCVDDNEDADVILHEYGHAINFSIEENWIFGDSGAIGEGFGDYWAGSYSLKTPNGPIASPENVYSWDGHGSFVECWGGRVLNATQLVYDDSFTYDAHAPVPGTFLSGDELWSAPNFAALYEAFNRGIPMAEIDQIVLEGFFGSTIQTMAEIATNTVNAAYALYPEGPHGQIFQEAFARQGMASRIENYDYIAPHIPPSSGSTAWTSSVQFTNPNSSTANLVITTYEANDSGSFTAIATSNDSLTAFQTMNFDPPGSGQRWVLIKSSVPLSGVNEFQRSPGEDRGHEAAAIPLISATETGTSLILPHVPADRGSFWSGGVLVNPNDTALSLSIELIGDQGSDLSSLLNPGVPTQLEPFQKFVSFLAPGPNNAAGIFDDSNSSEKVSWIKITANGQMAAFQLYGYQTGKAATSGIVATPDQNRTHHPVRMSLTGAEWAGFSLLNPDNDSVTLDVIAYDSDGNQLAKEQITVAGKSKVLGLNLESGFLFPSNTTPVIDLGPNSGLHTLLITAEETIRTFGVPKPLRVFELTGDLSSTELDGATVFGLATNLAFSNPQGVLELFKTDFDGDINVTYYTSNSSFVVKHSMTAGQSLQIATTHPDTNDTITSIALSGKLFSANMIYQDERGSLKVVNGKALEFNVNAN